MSGKRALENSKKHEKGQSKEKRLKVTIIPTKSELKILREVMVEEIDLSGLV